jgi:hypothetical protein
MNSSGIDNLTSDNEARLLDLTMRTREELIVSLTKKGIPEDRADKSLLVSLLDGVDRTILSKSRIKVDSKISDTNAQAASLIANVLTKINTKNIRVIDDQREIPQLPLDVEGITFIDGELDTGTQNNSFDTFIAKFPTVE